MSTSTRTPEIAAWNGIARAYARACRDTGGRWDFPTLSLCRPVLAALMLRTGMIPVSSIRR